MNNIKVTATSAAILLGLVALTYGGFAFYSLELDPTKWTEFARFLSAICVAGIGISVLGAHTAMLGALNPQIEEELLESVIESQLQSIELHIAPLNRGMTVFIHQIVLLLDSVEGSGTIIKMTDGSEAFVMESREEILMLINKED